MAQDNTLIILGICGFLTVCFGLLILAFIAIFRFSGRNFLGFLGILSQGAKDADSQASGRRVPVTRDLRAVADQHDFDAVLAKHIVNDQLAPTTPPNSAQNVPRNPQAMAGRVSIPHGTLPPTQQVNPPPATGFPPVNPPQQFGAQGANDPSNWQNPSLRPRPTANDLRRRDQDDDDDLLAGLIGDDGNVLG